MFCSSTYDLGYKKLHCELTDHSQTLRGETIHMSPDSPPLYWNSREEDRELLTDE